MKTMKMVGLALVLLPTSAWAAKKPKVAAAINQAHTVYVQAADGEETKPGLAKEDMQAIANVRTALRNWGRYTLTDDRGKADLIVVVRTASRRSDPAGGSAEARRVMAQALVPGEVTCRPRKGGSSQGRDVTMSAPWMKPRLMWIGLRFAN